MVTKNHFAFNICKEAAEESELEKGHEFQNPSKMKVSLLMIILGQLSPTGLPLSGQNSGRGGEGAYGKTGKF